MNHPSCASVCHADVDSPHQWGLPSANTMTKLIASISVTLCIITSDCKQLARVLARRNCRSILCGVRRGLAGKSASNSGRCRSSGRFARSLLGQHVSGHTWLLPRGRAASSSLAVALQRSMQLCTANSCCAVVRRAVPARRAAATAQADQETEALCMFCRQRSCRCVDSAAEPSAPRCGSDSCHRSGRLCMGQTLQLVCLETGL